METFTSEPAQRFITLIEGLCHVLIKHGRGRFIAAPMLLLIWNRVIRMSRRFARLAERVHLGTLSLPAPARSRDASPRPARVRPAAEALPGHFRWLVNMIPETEAIGGDLCWLLQRPEMGELFFNAPEVGRILRPLCRMLGVEPPAELRLPVRPRAPRPQETSEPEPETSEPEPAQPEDNDCSPQSHEPEPPREFSAEYWKLHPPPWLPKLE
jgi:HAMP domain-containing protein